MIKAPNTEQVVTELDLCSKDSQYESLYKVQPPFMRSESAHGFNGVVIRDKVNDVVQCHECGKWFGQLATHLRCIHDMSTREYKIKHGLFMATALCSKKLSNIRSRAFHGRNLDDIRALRRKVPKYHKGPKFLAHYNKHALCSAQIRERLRVVGAQAGRKPLLIDVYKYDRKLANVFRQNKNFRGCVKELGIQKAPGTLGYWDKIKVIAAVRSWVMEHGYISTAPNEAKNSHPVLTSPSHGVIIRVFGSYRRAMTQCGLTRVNRQYMFPRRAGQREGEDR
jgi:hypothetical protein